MSRGRLFGRTTTLAALVGLLLIVGTQSAFADVGLVSSTPADGSTVIGPLTEIRMEFAADAEASIESAADGTVLYDADGVEVPVSTRVESTTVVVVVPTEPLASGRFAVAITVRADDGHQISGGFEFAVEAPGPAEVEPSAVAEAPAVAEGGPPTVPPSILDSVLVHSDTSVGDWIARVARAASITAILLGIGTLVFGWLVFAGSTDEARVIIFWVRRAGAVIVLAVPFEVLGQSIIFAGGSVAAALGASSLSAALGSSFGLAILLRLAGGIALLLATHLTTVRSPIPSPLQARSRGGDGSAVAIAPPIEHESFRLPVSPIAIAGITALTLSYLFDGHTVSEAPPWLMKSSSAIHVLGGAIWVGGVAMLARTLGGRHRRGEPLHTAQLVVPFSTVAAAALVMVGLAGTAMALLIADAPAAFITSPWGQTLLAKVALVLVAGAIGAYNHLRLVPMLKIHPDHPVAVASIRATVRIETWLLVGSGILTAVLVSLSPV